MCFPSLFKIIFSCKLLLPFVHEVKCSRNTYKKIVIFFYRKVHRHWKGKCKRCRTLFREYKRDAIVSSTKYVVRAN